MLRKSRAITGGRVPGVVLVVCRYARGGVMGRMCLFSRVRGGVLDQGRPVPGAVVKRSFFWHWKSERGSDQAVTDEAGHFVFPAIWRRSWLGALLPHEPVVEQRIVIEHGGRRCEAWNFMRGTYREGEEVFRDQAAKYASGEEKALRIDFLQ